MLVVFIAVLGGLSAAWVALRDRSLAGLALRTGAIAALVVVAFPPERGAPPEGRATLAVVVDESRSMGDGGEGAASAIDELRAAWLDEATVSVLERVAELRFYAMSGALRRIGREEAESLSPSGESSRIGAALASLAAAPPDAALVLTDGRATPDDDALRSGLAAGAVFVGIVGERAAPPLRVDARASPAVGAPGDEVRIEALVRGPAGEAAIVEVLRVERRADLAVERETALESCRVSIGEAGTRATLTVRVPADARAACEFAVRASVGGATAGAGVVVAVRSRPVRALLLDAQPGWTTRFVAAALRDDPAVALRSVIALGGERVRVEEAGDGPGLDAAAIDLEEFDLLALGGGWERWVSVAEVEAWVARGGGALLYGANGGARLGLDAEDRGALFPDARVRSRTLGGGRLGAFESERAWREMFGAWGDPSLPARLARWLARREGEEFPAVEAAPSAREGERVDVTLRFPPEAIAPERAVVRIVGEGDGVRELEVRRLDRSRPILSGSFIAERPGAIELRAGGAARPWRMLVHGARDEELFAPAQIGALRAVAEASGGAVVSREDLPALAEDLREMGGRTAPWPAGERSAPWEALVIGAALLLAEWVMRRMRRP